MKRITSTRLVHLKIIESLAIIALGLKWSWKLRLKNSFFIDTSFVHPVPVNQGLEWPSVCSYNQKQIARADPKSFMLLSGYLGVPWQTDVQYNYAKDMSHVYYQGYPIIGAEVSTFHPIENGSFFHTYAADAAHVYFGTSTIEFADTETFVTLWNNINKGCSFGMYSKDTRHVYFGDKIVTGADTRSFKPLISGYGVDKRGIYKEGVFQPQLPKSFEPECNYG